MQMKDIFIMVVWLLLGRWPGLLPIVADGKATAGYAEAGYMIALAFLFIRKR